MKNLILICFALICLFSCGTLDELDRIEGMGPIVEETLALEDFVGIELDAPIDIVLEQGEYEVVAKGHQNIIDRLITNLSNDNLKIDLQNGNYKDFEMKIYITLPDLNFIEIDGAGDFEVGEFSIQELYCHINGAGDLSFNESIYVEEEFRIDIDGAADTYLQDLQANKVRVNVDGAGDITLRGSTNELEIDIDGMGDVEAFALESGEVDVFVDGLGKTEVFANEELDVHIDGIGNVYYKGDPTIYKEIDGIGRLYDAN